MKVFLGGTCNGSTWREELIDLLHGRIPYFNPVVKDWTPECQEVERYEKENKCNVHLYVITSQMTGVFSIAEAVDSVHNPKVVTLFHVIPEGFSEAQLRSLKAVADLITSRGGRAYVHNDVEASVGVLIETRMQHRWVSPAKVEIENRCPFCAGELKLSCKQVERTYPK
jgi:hypothetical protein